MTNEWQPIETAPKDQTSFLALMPGNDAADYIIMQVAEFEGRLYPDHMDYCVDWNDGFSLADATHWMPLPAPPEGDE